MSLIDFESLIKKADELPPLPGSTVKLISLLSGSDGKVEEITNVIKFDPALTLKLLRLANSAFSASKTTITSVHEAVSRLGTRRILSLALASHSRPMMESRVSAYGYHEGELWRHSVISMMVAENAQNFCQVSLPPAGSTAALLHDIGKLVMACFLDRQILALIRESQAEMNLTPYDAETQILGMNHAELGGLIARHWELPDTIVTGITYHHNPDQGFDLICDVVYLANVGAKNVSAKMEENPERQNISPQSAERLGFSLGDMDRLCDDSLAAFSHVANLFGASGPPK